MSYLALARKWRPQAFSQLIGQEHVTKALIKSLDHQRLHHAYIFTGTRGVGKTSVARLMAKALNCEQGVSSTPCLTCDACVAIEQGRFTDLIEIDAASKTRVEDTRELLENVQYAPTAGRYKIYLIDEVHMLSQHSFNALLKTLEEPPEHVKFLLATTDPQKLPVTVLSRCLQFHLRCISQDIIQTQLQLVLEDERIPFEQEALNLLAKAAAGSMRDALSLLDQAIASVDHELSAREVKSVLGYTQQDYVKQLLQALIDTDAKQLVSLSRQIAAEGGYYTWILDELLDWFHQITVCQALSDCNNPLLKPSGEVALFANQISAEDLQLFYQIAIKGKEDIHLAPSLLIGFEMVLLRMLAFKPAASAVIPNLAYESRPVVAELDCHDSVEAPHVPAADVENMQNTNVEPLDINPSNDWGDVLSRIKLTGLAQTALENAELIGKSERTIQLRVAKGHSSLFTPSVNERIEQALSEYFNDQIKISIVLDDSTQASPAQIKKIEQELNLKKAEESLQNDVFLQQLQQEFSAELVKNSIESL